MVSVRYKRTSLSVQPQRAGHRLYLALARRCRIRALKRVIQLTEDTLNRLVHSECIAVSCYDTYPSSATEPDQQVTHLRVVHIRVNCAP